MSDAVMVPRAWLLKVVDTLKPFSEVAEKLRHCHVVEICEPHPDNPSPNIAIMPREWLERAGDDLEAAVIVLHRDGALSEGQAAKMTGLDRVEVRKLSDALAASTPVGCWERTDVQRLMHPVMGYLLDKNVGQRVAEEASERAVDAMYRALEAPHQPLIGGWKDISTAPKDGTHFLAVDECGDASRCAYHSEGYIMSFCGQPVVQPFEPILWMPWPVAPPPPSVSIDKGSRPQEAVPTEGHGAAVVVALETACRILRGIPKPHCVDGHLTYALSDDVPEDIYTARTYVEHALSLLSTPQPADGCSSNEGAGE